MQAKITGNQSVARAILSAEEGRLAAMRAMMPSSLPRFYRITLFTFFYPRLWKTKKVI